MGSWFVILSGDLYIVIILVLKILGHLPNLLFQFLQRVFLVVVVFSVSPLFISLFNSFDLLFESSRLWFTYPRDFCILRSHVIFFFISYEDQDFECTQDNFFSRFITTRVIYFMKKGSVWQYFPVFGPYSSCQNFETSFLVVLMYLEELSLRSSICYHLLCKFKVSLLIKLDLRMGTIDLQLTLPP